MLDEHEPPLASSNNHHGDEAGPSAMSSQQPAASISTHDHEQAGPSTIEAAPLTKKASTSTVILVVPPADPWHLYYSFIFLTLFSCIYIYIYMVHVFYVHVVVVLNLHVGDHHDVYIVRSC